MVLSDFQINTDFNCIQAQISSVELRGVTLEREDGWLTTNFDELDIINSFIKNPLFSSLQTLIIAELNIHHLEIF